MDEGRVRFPVGPHMIETPKPLGGDLEDSIRALEKQLESARIMLQEAERDLAEQEEIYRKGEYAEDLGPARYAELLGVRQHTERFRQNVITLENRLALLHAEKERFDKGNT